MVTAEDEPETIAQRLLTASIKLGRPPNQCVFFDSTVEGITAAHNCTFKAVAVQVLSGIHGWYSRLRKDFERDANKHPSRFFRMINEIPFVLAIIIVIAVVVKPF
jgi:uncharacterized membrane protein